jgi:hypothetical protein
MKKLWFAALILLSGCATQQVVPLNVHGIERSEQVRLQDLRPPSEKQGEIFSLLLTSDAYAIYRIAEDASAPPAIRFLQHRAFEALGTRMKPLEIKIHHLVVYRNMQSEFRRGAIGVGLGGVLGGVIGANTVTDPSGIVNSLADPNAFNALQEAEFKRALYSSEENPGRGSVHIVYLESEINGKRVFTRTLAPTKVKEGENALFNVLEAATKYHLAQY